MNKFLKLGFLTTISILGLYFAFKGVDLSKLIIHIKSVNLQYFLFAIFILLMSCVLRAYRWNLILNPLGKVSFENVLSATMIGYFGNGVLAFRLGELLKAYSLSQKSNITTTQAFGTVILERLLDIITLLIIFLVLLPWFPFEYEILKYSAIGFSIFSLIAIVMLFVFTKFNFWKKNKRFRYNSSKSIKKIYLLLFSILEGLTSLKKNRSSYYIIVLSIVIWCIYLFETVIIIKACNLDFSIIEAGILLIVGSIALGIPALPGSAGTYDAGLKYSLEWVYKISSEMALNYAIVSHFIAYVPCLIIGFIYFLLANIKINEIKNIDIEK